MSLTLTPEAKLYFIDLISTYKQRSKTKKKLNIRIKAIAAGTNRASVDLSYCPEGDQEITDLTIDQGNFILYVEQRSVLALEDSIIDYVYSYDENKNKLSKHSKLQIKAPFLKKINKSTSLVNLDLFNKIKDFLNEKIAPVLARHKGMVKLLSVSDDGKEVTLKFEGNCKGCGIANLTLKNIIEKSLKTEFPEIILIKDVTNHADQ